MSSNDKNYSLYKTLDDSFTLKNHHIDENYHSNAGAHQEAYLKYYDGCSVGQRCEKNNITVFEVGFGLGYNLIPFLDNLDQLENKIFYFTSEYDTNLFLELINQIEQLYPKEHQSFFSSLLEEKKFKSDKIDITILEGDVRSSIQTIQTDSVDVIYHDPFSPYKNTECWTKDFFKEEYRILNDSGILSTYSISTPVRSGMYQAGFEIWEGIGDETKSSGTIATKKQFENLRMLQERSYNKLFISPERIPFRDPELNMDRNEIKKVRMLKKEKEDYSDCIRK